MGYLVADYSTTKPLHRWLHDWSCCSCQTEGQFEDGSPAYSNASSIIMRDYEGSGIWRPSYFLEVSVQRASDSSVLYDAVTDFVTTNPPCFRTRTPSIVAEDAVQFILNRKCPTTRGFDPEALKWQEGVEDMEGKEPDDDFESKTIRKVQELMESLKTKPSK